MGKKVFTERWLGVTAIRYKTVRLTSAEILALNTTAKELVPAPGSGKVIEFLSAVSFLDYGTATYATYGNLVIQTGTTGTDLSDTVAKANHLQKTADHYVVFQALSAEAQLDANESIELYASDGDPVTGDGELVIHVAYRIHDFN